jgi:bla regulator protein BlaR1
MDTDQIESTFRSNATIMFALIDNADTIVFRVYGTGEQPQPEDYKQYQYTRAEIQQNFDQDLREYSQDVQTFEDFLNAVHNIEALAKEMSIKILVFPEKYALLMSSTPGIRILAEYRDKGVVEKVRYSAETGNLFTWEVASGKISEVAPTIELPYGRPAYWTPATPWRGDPNVMDNKVTITLFDQQGQIIGEKLIHIQYDGSMYYTVQSSPEVMVGATSSQPSLEEAVSQAIKGRGNAYLSSELTTEGHLILQTEENNNNGTVKVYVLASVGNFGFENGIFTKVSGSGAIPTVITFSKNDQGEYSLIEYKVPLDGAGYAKSIQEMFPSSLLSKVQNGHLNYQDLAKQQEAQAQAYLLSQGRKELISEKHVEKQYPTNLSKQARGDLEYKFKYELGGYPYYLGTREVVENGVRYIYEFKQELGLNDSSLIFTKYQPNGTIVEKRKYTANDIGLVEVTP